MDYTLYYMYFLLNLLLRHHFGTLEMHSKTFISKHLWEFVWTWSQTRNRSSPRPGIELRTLSSEGQCSRQLSQEEPPWLGGEKHYLYCRDITLHPSYFGMNVSSWPRFGVSSSAFIVLCTNSMATWILQYNTALSQLSEILSTNFPWYNTSVITRIGVTEFVWT